MNNVRINIFAYIILVLISLLSMFISLCISIFLHNIFDIHKGLEVIIYIVMTFIFYTSIVSNIKELLIIYGRKKYKDDFKKFELEELEKKY